MRQTFEVTFDVPDDPTYHLDGVDVEDALRYWLPTDTYQNPTATDRTSRKAYLAAQRRHEQEVGNAADGLD